MKYLFYLILFICLSSCAIGYKKLTTENLERKHKRGRVALLNYNDLPLIISDTISREYEKYYLENKGHVKVQYSVSHFISFDSTIQGNHIKYQDFYSDKFRLPFGYFFEFGKSKFFIPYGEQKIGNMFLFYDGHLYFKGHYFGDKKEIYRKDDPDYYRVDYQNFAYWRIKL